MALERPFCYRYARGGGWVGFCATTVFVVCVFGACEPQADTELELVPGRMAVLPFHNPTGDPALDQVALDFELAAGDVAGAVTGAGMVMFPVSTRTAGEVSAEDPPGTVAARTGASLILRGTISAVGDEVELKAEVLDPVDGSVMHDLPAERGPASSPSAAIQRLADRVAGALAVHLDTDWTSPHLYSVPTLEAYRIAKQGDSLFSQTLQEESIPVFYEAYEADTMYLMPLFTAAAAHGNRGRAAVRDSLLDYIEARVDRLTPIEEYNLAWFRGPPEKALVAARAARELDPLGWTYGVGLRANQAGYFHEAVEALSHRAELAAMGNYSAQTWPAWRGQYTMALHATGDHETELAEARLANRDFPDDPWWIWNEMMALAGLGRVDEVLALVDSAEILLETLELPRFYENLEDIGTELKVHGHPDAGDDLLEKVISHYREIGNPLQLADALGFAGRTQEAFEVLTPVMAQATSADQLGWYGSAAAIIGNESTAEEILRQLEGRSDSGRGNNLRYQAAIHGALGRCEKALELYGEATGVGFSYSQAWGGEWWHRDWEAEPVRRNCPEFSTLLNRDQG